MCKVLVTGGRSYNDEKTFYKTMDHLRMEYDISVVVHGGAAGADSLARKWGKETLGAYRVKEYPARWDDLKAPGAIVKERRNGMKYNISAGPQRNQRMLDDNPDIELVVVFPGGVGTRDMELRARRGGFPVITIAEVK